MAKREPDVKLSVYLVKHGLQADLEVDDFKGTIMRDFKDSHKMAVLKEDMLSCLMDAVIQFADDH